MNKLEKILILAVIVLVVFGVFNQTQQVKGAAFPGSYAYISTSSTRTVGPASNGTLIFTANDSCHSRVISVYKEVTLSFASTTFMPTATIGHIQSASTTVAYDSGIYGCGEVWAYSFSSTTVSLSAF